MRQTYDKQLLYVLLPLFYLVILFFDTYAYFHKFPWLCGACVSLPTHSWHSTVCFLALTPPLTPPMFLCHTLKTWSAPAGLAKTAFFTTALTCPTGASQRISLTSAGEIMKQGKKEENVYFLDYLLIKRVMPEGGVLGDGCVWSLLADLSPLWVAAAEYFLSCSHTAVMQVSGVRLMKTRSQTVRSAPSPPPDRTRAGGSLRPGQPMTEEKVSRTASVVFGTHVSLSARCIWTCDTHTLCEWELLLKHFTW